jgi:hypothetical protein
VQLLQADEVMASLERRPAPFDTSWRNADAFDEPPILMKNRTETGHAPMMLRAPEVLTLVTVALAIVVLLVAMGVVG